MSGTYSVIMSVTEDYELKVQADSAEEAIEMVKEEWEERPCTFDHYGIVDTHFNVNRLS